VDECKPLDDGIDPVKHREASTSRFLGVSWNKSNLKWRAVCRRTDLGLYAMEEDAARACSKYLKAGN
jgi:hypothetical protein